MAANGGQKKTTSSSSNHHLKQQKLRQRHRQQMAQDKREETRTKKKLESYSTQTNQYMLKFYIVVGTAIVVTVISILYHVNPKFLHGRSKQGEAAPIFLGTLYGPNIQLDKSLPRFFRTFSISKDENLRERTAVRRVILNRKRISSAGAPSVLKAWDNTQLEYYIQERNLCGDDFQEAYQATLDSQDWMRQRELVKWCLLATRVVEGFVSSNVTVHKSPLMYLKERGLLLESSKESSSTGLSTMVYMEPRNDPLEDRSRTAQLPSLMLTWLLTNHTTRSASDYRAQLNKYFEKLVEQKGADQYLKLEEDCGEESSSKSRRTVFSICEMEESCCYYSLPKSSSIRFRQSGDDEEDVNEKEGPKSSSLRT